MKIGLRTIKTGIAVSTTMLVTDFLNIEYPFFALIAALIAMQPTVSDSWHSGINRIIGTFIGAFVGLLFGFIAPINFLLVGLGLILLIYTMNRLGWTDSINIAGVVFLAIILNDEGVHIIYAVNRLIDTFIGISIALGVNYLIFPPTYDKKAISVINNVSSQVWLCIDKAVDMLTNEENYLEEIANIINEIEVELSESDKFLQLQLKEEKVKVYGVYNSKEMQIRLNLVKETLQHLHNLYGALEKGVKKEVLEIIIEDINILKDSMKKNHLPISKKQKRLINLQPSINIIRTIKKGLKYNPRVNQYPTDDVVRLMVVIYNLEELMSKVTLLIDLLPSKGK
ncbi:aromatic acid exporter family protein [Alkaliphilus pronyensis]|uniref:Aromatic acid exporter family protein n=1 Tax=Alkaliphilus pronyensis TaxID=1482732 RepID=A0A6I0F549_9FIRM|nr:aromatic acid exporter family protein [Alkaliphilus pronyensis]KAB3530306.1 aromatic acid exporter family protein [Alkaliphilus pronyensis]